MFKKLLKELFLCSIVDIDIRVFLRQKKIFIKLPLE